MFGALALVGEHADVISRECVGSEMKEGQSAVIRSLANYKAIDRSAVRDNFDLLPRKFGFVEFGVEVKFVSVRNT